MKSISTCTTRSVAAALLLSTSVPYCSGHSRHCASPAAAASSSSRSRLPRMREVSVAAAQPRATSAANSGSPACLQSSCAKETGAGPTAKAQPFNV